jgi:hypothetical protein
VAERRPKPAPSRRPDEPRFARVIFYNADLGMVSPVVSAYRERPVEELLRKSKAMSSTNFPNASCARFIGWCLRRRGAAGFDLGVGNLPVPSWQPHGDGAARPAGSAGCWRRRAGGTRRRSWSNWTRTRSRGAGGGCGRASGARWRSGWPARGAAAEPLAMLRRRADSGG